MCANAIVVTSICQAFPTRCVDGAMIKLAFGPGSMSAVVWWLALRPVTRTTWAQFPAAVLCTHDPSIGRPSIGTRGSRPQAIAVRPSVQSQCTVHARVTARPEPREATATSRDLHTDTVRARACQGWSRGRGRHATYLGRSRGSRARAHAPPNARGIATAPHVLGAGRRAASVSSLPMRPHMAHT